MNLGDRESMKVLVTGGTGLLGYWIVYALRSRGFEVYATYHEKSPPQLDAKWIKLDLEDWENAISSVRTIKPDIIIHTAAYTDVDGCEIDKARAFKINYLGTSFLVKASKDVELFIYISTDYVFNGERGFYGEEDIPAPVNYYGLTKLLGEVAVKTLLNNSCIVRVSGLYGYSPTGKKNFGLIALEKLMRGEPVEAFTNQWLSPTYVKSLAETITMLIEKKHMGILHMAGERLSRYEFTTMLADALGVDRGLVKPKLMEAAKLVAKRPRDSSLNVSKARKLGLIIPPTSECLKDMILTYKEFM
jgi:dTDP-4-dehydrorhamnose reductase